MRQIGSFSIYVNHTNKSEDIDDVAFIIRRNCELLESLRIDC